jgi:hypothetical protein
MGFQGCDLPKALVSILKNLRYSSNRAFVALITRMRFVWGFSEAAMSSRPRKGRKRGNDRACVRFLAVAMEEIRS